MDETPNLKLPYILPSQAQKHVTHNEALRLLDAIVNLSVKSRTTTGAPVAPAAGDRYIVASPATGTGSGKNGMVASFIDDGWFFIQPAGKPMPRRKRSFWFLMEQTGTLPAVGCRTNCPYRCSAFRRRRMRSIVSRFRRRQACSTMQARGIRSRSTSRPRPTRPAFCSRPAGPAMPKWA